MASRTISVEIVGDANSLQRAFKSVDSSSSKFGKSISRMGVVAGAGLAAVGVAAGVAGLKMLNMAGDAAEVDSKLKVVFGRELPGLKKNLDAFASATGASSFKLREQAADMGALLGPLLGTKKGAADMSEQFVKLATDLGSFNNVPVDDALLAIRSGLVGEAEPLRRFGVLLNEAAVKQEALRLGLVKGKEALTEQDKVQARASLIMQQTTQATGDAERTSGSYANQMKALKNALSDTATTMGQALLPAATAVLKELAKGAQGVRDFVSDFQKAKGLEAKVKVVIEGLKDLSNAALKIAVDLGKQISDSLGRVNWNEAGTKMAAGIGDALARGLPVAGKLAGVIAAGFLLAVKEINWVTIGREIGAGIKEGTVKGAKEFIKEGGQELIRAAQSPMEFTAKKLGTDVGESFTSAFGRSSEKGIASEKKVAALAMKQGWDPAIANAVLSGNRIGSGLATGTAAGIVKNTPQARAAAVTSGRSIGVSLGQGVAQGIASQLGYAAAAAEHLVIAAEQAARAAAKSKSPSRLFADLGADVVRGFILGINENMPKVTGKTAEAIQNALEAARARVEKFQVRFGEAFGKLADFAKRAFDAKTSALLDTIDKKFQSKIDKWSKLGDALTPAEQAIADLDRAEAKRARDRALDEARAGGDPEAIRAAELAITRAGLEDQAALERAALDKRVADNIAKLDILKQREAQNLDERRNQLGLKLDEQLVTLQERLAKHPEEYNKINEKIKTLLKKFGIPMRESGKLLGDAFADGIRDSFANVERAAKKLAQIVADYVPHSPAKKGPLAEPPGWGSYLTTGFATALNSAARATAGITASPAASGFGGSGGLAVAGGGTVVNVYGDITGNDLVETVRREINRIQKRNGTNGYV